MAGVGIKFNDRKMKAFLKEVSSNVKDIHTKDKKFWTIMAGFALADVDRHFEKELGPKGKWKAWSRIYKKRMEKIGKGGNLILQDKGDLRKASRMADNSVRRRRGELIYNPAKSKDGKPYAANHDQGLNGMPQRQFMWLSQRALNNMSKAIAHYALEGK